MGNETKDTTYWIGQMIDRSKTGRLPYSVQALGLYAQKMPKEAIDCLRDGIERHPDVPEYIADLARLYASEGRSNEAMGEVSKLLDIADELSGREEEGALEASLSATMIAARLSGELGICGSEGCKVPQIEEN